MRKVLTVTANPAYDVTYEVAGLVPGAVHRVERVHERVGGKGVNVARVLRVLGTDVTAVCLADAGFLAAAEREGVPLDVVEALPRVRRTVVVRGADGATTSLWEPGAPAEPGGAGRLVAAVDAAIADTGGLVVSGSRPVNVASDLPARLAEVAVAANRPVVVDVDGEALTLASQVPGVVLVPNREELAELVGAPCETAADVVAAGTQLVARGAGAVVATRGADGLVAVTTHGTWCAHLDASLDGNPTGAGDAVAASLIRQLARGTQWPDLLADAVALSAASVLAPVAGAIDAEAYPAFANRAIVRSLVA